MATSDKFRLGLFSRLIVKHFLPNLPNKLAQHALVFFMDNFNRSGFEDTNFQRWKPRKVSTNRKMLVKTGTLRNNFKVESATLARVAVVNDTPYAKYHNEGTPNMPQRKLLDNSVQLEKELKQIIKK